jgi:hypothetical protein
MAMRREYYLFFSTFAIIPEIKMTIRRYPMAFIK